MSKVTEVRSINYQDYESIGEPLPNHWMVIVSVDDSNFAEQLYFPDTEQGEIDARSVKVGDDVSKFH
jgi:hypothetical protein